MGNRNSLPQFLRTAHSPHQSTVVPVPRLRRLSSLLFLVPLFVAVAVRVGCCIYFVAPSRRNSASSPLVGIPFSCISPSRHLAVAVVFCHRRDVMAACYICKSLLLTSHPQVAVAIVSLARDSPLRLCLVIVCRHRNRSVATAACYIRRSLSPSCL